MHFVVWRRYTDFEGVYFTAQNLYAWRFDKYAAILMTMELESHIRGRVVVAWWDFQAPSLKYYLSKEVRDSKKCRVAFGFRRSYWHEINISFKIRVLITFQAVSQALPASILLILLTLSDGYCHYHHFTTKKRESS